jgi:outer membrane protein
MQTISRDRALVLAVCALALASVAAQRASANDFAIPLEVPEQNFIGLGVGAYPDYLGSDDYAVGAAPIGRLSIGGSRFVRVLVNEVRVNVLDDPNWQLGPSLLWRFAREDVDDKVVRHVHEIDDALSLGVFGGYLWRDPGERRKQAGVSAWALGDVSGTYDGWTAGLNAFAMQPVAPRVTLAGGAAFTYGSGNYMDEYFGVTASDALASGLPVYAPGAGMRDARAWGTAVYHLTPQWHVGAGVLYSRLVGDAGDSPIVSEQGSKNQWIYGVVALYAW